MKVALVYDRINKFGGAERVMLALSKIYPEAPIYTLVHEPESSLWTGKIKIIPTFLNKIPMFRKKHELLAPIAPLAFETLNFSGYDVIISITSSDAKSIITKPNQLHICYCLTPTRYFWSGEGEYSGDVKMKLIPEILRKYFKSVDLLTSTRPDKYLSISSEVQNRVKKYYNRNSQIIYPPIEDKFYSLNPLSQKNRDYYLAVGRLVPYKKFDLIIKAFNKLNLPLVIVGKGSEENYLRSIAGKKISFISSADDKRLIEYYRHAKAVIFPQEEDFGLIPLESQAQGTPVIAFGKGGALETVINGVTGIFFDEQTEESLLKAVKEFRKMHFSSIKCIENAEKFSNDIFQKKFSRKVEELWEDFNKS